MAMKTVRSVVAAISALARKLLFFASHAIPRKCYRAGT
jgi:hypothetical protein